MGIDKVELAKWEVDQMGIDKVRIDKVGRYHNLATQLTLIVTLGPGMRLCYTLLSAVTVLPLVYNATLTMCYRLTYKFTAPQQQQTVPMHSQSTFI